MQEWGPTVNLRESIDDPGQGAPLPDELPLAENYRYAAAFMHGYSEATGLRFATSTHGPTIQIHNLSNDTRSAEIDRKDMLSVRRLLIAMRAQLDALPYWEAEADDWGPDPWPE